MNNINTKGKRVALFARREECAYPWYVNDLDFAKRDESAARLWMLFRDEP